ncbi:alkaline phosphatase [Bacillus swezeyi]|nr:alkaline phosphatase [Bacillus swezeyi]
MNRSHTGWTTGGQTGEEVPVYAYGPGKEQFTGIGSHRSGEKDFHILQKRK